MKKILMTVFFLLPTIIFGQFQYDQFRSMFTIQDFFERKILQNELRNSIAKEDEVETIDPMVEVYHDSDLYEFGSVDPDSRYANLQTGLRLNFSIEESLIPRWEIFALVNMNYITTTTGLIPVIEIPFPYILDKKEGYTEALFGGGLSVGDPDRPWIRLDAGVVVPLETPAGSTVFTNNQNALLFNIQSPFLGAFIEGLEDGNLPSGLDQIDLLRYGLRFLNMEGSTVFSGIKAFRELQNIQNKEFYSLGVTRAFGFLTAEAKARYNKDGASQDLPPVDLYWVKMGLDVTTGNLGKFSETYATKIDLYLGLNYVNPGYGMTLGSRGALPSNDTGSMFEVPGLGFKAQVVFQNPFLLTLDSFVVLLQCNLAFLQLLTGDSEGFDQTMDDVSEQFDNMGTRLEDGTYKGNLYNRLIIGVETNDPVTLEKFPFAKNQTHVYVKLGVFY